MFLPHEFSGNKVNRVTPFFFFLKLKHLKKQMFIFINTFLALMAFPTVSGCLSPNRLNEHSLSINEACLGEIDAFYFYNEGKFAHLGKCGVRKPFQTHWEAKK